MTGNAHTGGVALNRLPPRLKGARKGCKTCLGALDRVRRSACLRMGKAMAEYGVLSDQYAEARGEYDEIVYITDRWMYLIEGRAYDLGIRPGKEEDI